MRMEKSLPRGDWANRRQLAKSSLRLCASALKPVPSKRKDAKPPRRNALILNPLPADGKGGDGSQPPKMFVFRSARIGRLPFAPPWVGQEVLGSLISHRPHPPRLLRNQSPSGRWWPHFGFSNRHGLAVAESQGPHPLLLLLL